MKPILKVFIIALTLSGCGDENSPDLDSLEGQTPPVEYSFQERNKEMISELRDSCISLSTTANVDSNLVKFEQELLFAETNYESCAANYSWSNGCNADAMRLFAVMVGMVCSAWY